MFKLTIFVKTKVRIIKILDIKILDKKMSAFVIENWDM